MWKVTVFRRFSQFKSTVCLPTTSFPSNIKHKSKHEEELKQICKFNDLYQWQENSNRSKCFVLHDGPPYANGDLHVGHALNKVIKDITNRYKLLCGYQIDYKPGWDCHGLPIEMKALKSEHFKTLSPLHIRHKARKFAEKTVQQQKNAFKQWAILADWDNDNGCYYTYSKSYEALELKYFYEMFKKGLIYRDLKPVYWSPSSRTALAESELEYNEKHISTSIYVIFPVVFSHLQQHRRKTSVLVWTTQPWTLPANQCLCYCQDATYSIITLDDDSCCIVATDAVPRISKELSIDCEIIDSIDSSQLEGVVCSHPMDSSRTMKLYPAAHATADKGTGIVHTAPAHGAEDFQVAQEYSLLMESHVDGNGYFTEHCGYDLEGKFIFGDGNEAVIDILKRRNTLVRTYDFVHSYPYDWRTKKPIFVTTSRQWFIDTKKLQEKALECLPDVQFLLESGYGSMKSMLKARPYWCISRQRVWGVPIPVFFHKESGNVLINDSSMQHILSLVEEHGSDVWFDSSINKLLPKSALQAAGYEGKVEDFEAGKDILDIWFDSGISWATVLKNCDEKSPVVADMYVEGKDQYNGWFQSSLLTSVGLQDTAPYKSVMVHGFCVAEDGQKMSKSLGNVIDPMVVVQGGKNLDKDPSYGADTLRWWAAKSNISSHVQISKTIIKDSSASVQKIRSGLRFLLSNLNDYQPDSYAANYPLQPIDQYFASALKDFVSQVTDQYEAYKYSSVCRTVLNFVTKLSSLYFSIIKDRLYCEEKDGELRRSCQTVLYLTLNALVKSVAPILPHLAEEVMLHHPCANSTSAFKDGWIDGDNLNDLFDTDVVGSVEKALPFREALFSLISSQNTSQPTAYDVDLFIPPNVMLSVQNLQHENSTSESSLCEILSCAKATIHILADFSPGLSKEIFIDSNRKTSQCFLNVSLSNAFKCPRCRKHTSEKNGTLCSRCTKALSDGWDQ